MERSLFRLSVSALVFSRRVAYMKCVRMYGYATPAYRRVPESGEIVFIFPDRKRPRFGGVFSVTWGESYLRMSRTASASVALLRFIQ